MSGEKDQQLWGLLPPSSVDSVRPSIDGLLDSLVAIVRDCRAARPAEASYMGNFLKKCTGLHPPLRLLWVRAS